MSTVNEQDFYGFPTGNVGQPVLVRVTILSISNLAYTVQALSVGNLGDTSNTAVVGHSQLHPHSAQNPFKVGDQVAVRGIIQSVSGSGATAQLTVSLASQGNVGELSTTIVVGPKQVTSVTAQ